MALSRLRPLLPPLQLTDPLPLRADRAAPARRPRAEDARFLRHLGDTAVLPPHALVQALALQSARTADLAALLVAHGLVTEPAMTAARAAFHGLPLRDPATDPPDVRLIDRLGARECLLTGVLPWRRIGEVTVILVDRPDAIPRHRDRLEAVFGPVSFALAPRAGIEAALQSLRRGQMRRAAEERTATAESCRTLAVPSAATLTGCLAAVSLALFAGTKLVLAALTLWALGALILAMGLKMLALRAALRPAEPPAGAVVIARLPVVSVMVALYREADIASRLVRRLGRIDYPRDRFDVVLVVEEDDTLTRAALDRADLPTWMRIVVVPDGPLKTKPRALNYGLDFCRGSIIGVYDAEDAPDPGQIHAVVTRFHQRGADLACLQGMLDFYNPRRNWLSRCFTMEYAAWFRVILPGLDRLGLPIPLGGTTLFFRRAALDALRGWDAHNVTEDADLGVRLYRHGLRTEVIATVTEEEANCHAYPWIKQRSRWIKGYMMTWRVHMRDPVRLWRDLGTKGFLGFQVLFLCSLSHALLAPVLISLWAVALGLPHPLSSALPAGAMRALTLLFLVCEAMNFALGLIALRRTRHRFNPLWLLTLAAYHPLASLAAYKALWEVVRRPFYWDKTGHGAVSTPPEA